MIKMKRLLGLSNIVRAKVFGARKIQDAAKDVHILEPSSKESLQPLVVLPGMLDRVTAGVPGHSTAKKELGDAQTSILEHAPVVQYILSDCLVHKAGVEFQGGFWRKSDTRIDRIMTGPTKDFIAGIYCMRSSSANAFGHWLTDACPNSLLRQPGETVFLDLRSDWPDTRHYSDAFSVGAREPEVAFVSRLRIVSDFSQGELKRKRYDELRCRLRSYLGEQLQLRRPVYLRRGNSGNTRLIDNEGRLCEVLVQHGFEVLDVVTPFDERMKKLALASIVVSVDGSHLNHAIFAVDKGSIVISLIPADRFTMVHRGICHAMGLRFGCVVMHRAANGYFADPEEVLKTLDLFN